MSYEFNELYLMQEFSEKYEGDIFRDTLEVLVTDFLTKTYMTLATGQTLL